MKSRRWRGGRGGVVEQDPVVWRAGRTIDGGGVPVEGWLNSSRWSSARWRLDEQEPVEAGGGRR